MPTRPPRRAPGCCFTLAAVALESTRLPDFEQHKDPADRLIIATARRHGTLVTCDRPILQWASAHKHVRVMDGRP
jgi:PIN domain nuclease of toxin-antitoxin system